VFGNQQYADFLILMVLEPILIAGVEVMARLFVLVSKAANALLDAGDIRLLVKITIPLDVRLCELKMLWH